ncbi:transposase, partial [Leptospira sp. B5-022]|uniref:transposase n=1 Tax=Leptospira sp. B5-022 TaxID=1242992 RepID=UPI000561676B
PNENRDISKIMAKRPYVCVDTAVLYSAGERASQGRKRYRHSGQTSSIYLSEKLGGRQVGTLVQTIAIKQGPVFFSSVSNQKADTLGPLIKEHLPTCTPLFTDQGYPWLWGIYKNHRSVNHSARSKDNRFRFARNRWSKNGVHNQVAEGNHRVLKTAFAAYGYIKPKYSQMYLNEFSFIKNANVFGLDVLVECDGDDANEGMRCRDRDAFAVNPRAGMKEAVRIERKGFVRKIQRKRTENWLQDSLQKIQFESKTFAEIPNIQNHNGFGILNSSTAISKAKKYELPTLEKYNSFWLDSNIKKFQRNRELEYQKTASKIWNWIQAGRKKGKQYSVIEICDELEIHKITAMTILRKWIKLRLIARRRIGFARYDRRINFYIKPLKQELPLILYSKLKTKTSKRVTRNEK